MAMTFDGFGSGETDFDTLVNTGPQASLADLEDILTIIAGQVVSPVPNINVSLIVTGHADRQDRSDFSCDQRRQSEIEAARDRAVSAWESIKARVNAIIVQSGGQAGDWWETSPNVTWGLVFAAAGMLKHDPPSSEDQRRENRRVVVLASVFSPA